MNRRTLKRLSILLVLLLVLAWGCLPEEISTNPTETASTVNEAAFWNSLPLPDDAEVISVAEGVNLGFVTSVLEPELFDFYTIWLKEQGWRRQAPTEAMVTLPHQTWRRDGIELLIELHGLDEQGRTIVWLKMEEK